LEIHAVFLDLEDLKKNKLTVAIQAGVFQHMPKKHSAPGGPAKVKNPRKTRLTPAPRVIKGQFKRFLTGIFYKDDVFQTFSLKKLKAKTMKKYENTKRLKIRIVFFGYSFFRGTCSSRHQRIRNQHKILHFMNRDRPLCTLQISAEF
jgi:hypothetical protein